MTGYKVITDYLNELYPDARCELKFSKDYELLLAVVLSAQTTDKRVNEVTKTLFKYSLEEISLMSLEKLQKILRPLGSYHKKSIYVKEIATRLIKEQEGVVPNNRIFLESLKGVGRKSANVVLSNLFNEECIAVDTHVERVSKRLGIALKSDNPLKVEKRLEKYFSNYSYKRLHHQLVLFGRYHCKAKSPECLNCKLNQICKYEKKRF